MNVDEDTKPVLADDWENMSYDELLNQRTIMQNRYDYLIQTGNTSIATAISQGLERLEQIIKDKT